MSVPEHVLRLTMALEAESGHFRSGVLMQRGNTSSMIKRLVRDGGEVFALLECQREVWTHCRFVCKAAVRKVFVLWQVSLTPLAGY